MSHVIELKTASDITENGSDIPSRIQTRVAAHCLLNLIPDLGLTEVIESIIRILEYHSEVPPSAPVSLAPMNSFAAAIGIPRVRPVFHVDEEGV